VNGNQINFEADKEAVRKFFLDHVNQNTVFFHSLEEKIEHLIENLYYEKETFDLYDFNFVKSLFKKLYAKKFRFRTFMGAFKFYTQYAMKTFDGSRYIERYEDRVAVTALYLAQGDEEFATELAFTIINQEYQPATPTFLNSGKKSRGELVSCFLMRVEDNRESISRALAAAFELSAKGGGVAFNLTNLREAFAPIKNVHGASSGVQPVMKLFEDMFSYANQLGARQGAGAVYLNIHHPDIFRFLDTKKENADEKIRIKTLSLGVVIPDVFLRKAQAGESVYLFSPYDIQRVYGVGMSDISITEHYDDMVANPEIKKYEANPREIMERIAEIQFESGYPYIVYEDVVNAANPIEGRVSMSNLCSEILQVSTPSHLNVDLSFSVVGRDISCNLGSNNVAKIMQSNDIGKVVATSMRALSAVSVLSNLEGVPSIANGNEKSHAVGLGQMNLHGYFGSVGIEYGGEESIDFTNVYFGMINYWSIVASMEMAKRTGQKFDGFEKSQYADGSYFKKYIEQPELWEIKTDRVRELFSYHFVPKAEDWAELAREVAIHGLFNAYRLAVPPTGSISYINDSTASINAIPERIESRKEAMVGRAYFPAPGMTNENVHLFKDAYELGWKAQIDVYAAATPHTDQGLSCTLFFLDSVTTREINRAQMYARKKGIKTIYYIRVRQKNITGDNNNDINMCTSCSL
jgi:ribonucleoside-diphosphate reductase alpha chain